jgi:3-hydroxyacyl-CoA dehydrogenase
MYFFAPAHGMKFIEIVRSCRISNDAIAAALELAKRLNKIRVVVKSGFGFIGNRLFLPYLREAQLMLLEGVMPDRIDQVAYDWGFPMFCFIS